MRAGSGDEMQGGQGVWSAGWLRGNDIGDCNNICGFDGVTPIGGAGENAIQSRIWRKASVLTSTFVNQIFNSEQFRIMQHVRAVNACKIVWRMADAANWIMNQSLWFRTAIQPTETHKDNDKIIIKEKFWKSNNMGLVRVSRLCSVKR